MALKEVVLTKYNQLRSENEALIQDLAQLEEQQLKYKSSEDKWSIIQVLNHLRGTETGTLRYIQKKLKYGGLKRVNWNAEIRAFFMRLINNSSVRFKMPSVLSQPTTEGSLEDIQAEWHELRIEWIDFIKQFPDRDLDKAVFRHPIFGRLSFSQAIDSMISHQNHHKKQIKRIKKAISLNNK